VTLDTSGLPKGTKGSVTLRVRTAGNESDSDDEPGAADASAEADGLGEEIILVSLDAGRHESQTLDLIFDHYAEFSVEGPPGAAVHLAGYLVPDEGGEPSDDNEDSGGLPPGMTASDLQAMLEARMGGGGMGGEEDDDSDESRSSDDESDDSDQDLDSDDVDAVARAGGGRGGRVKIEEVEEESDSDEAPTAVPINPGKRKAEASATTGKDEGAKKCRGAAPATPAAPAAPPAKMPAPDVKAKPTPAKSPAAPKKEGSQEPPEGVQGLGKKGTSKTFDNGFRLETLSTGPPGGKFATGGKQVTMRYKGWLQKGGKVFDQNQRGFKFVLGVGQVIKGWDRGVAGMREGDKRRLTIPGQMAYGREGVRGTIPPNATLCFDVELVKVG